MAFTDPFIRRPVLATVVSLLIVLLGLQAFGKLSIRQYPEMESALITVTTAYPGANAETIQGYITQPLQQSLASAEGIDYMTSVSRQNFSVISIYARIGTDSDRLFTDLLAKANAVKNQLPQNAEDPVLNRQAADGMALHSVSTAIAPQITFPAFCFHFTAIPSFRPRKKPAPLRIQPLRGNLAPYTICGDRQSVPHHRCPYTLLLSSRSKPMSILIFPLRSGGILGVRAGHPPNIVEMTNFL